MLAAFSTAKKDKWLINKVKKAYRLIPNKMLLKKRAINWKAEKKEIEKLFTER